MGFLRVRVRLLSRNVSERGRTQRKIGAVEDDLLDLGGAGTRGESLINSGVILFGRKLVENRNVWKTSRRIQRVMKSLCSLFPLLPIPNESVPT